MSYVITGTGAVTSAGLDVVTSAASFRAGLMRTATVVDFGNSVTTHRIYPCTNGYSGTARWAILLQLGLQDLLKQAELPASENTLFWERTGFILCLPLLDDERYGWIDDADESAAIGASVCQSIDLPRFGCQQTIAHGHVGATKATTLAVEWIEQGNVDRVLIAGVDSYLDAETIAWLHEENRLLSDEQSNGMIPGEASGAFLLESESAARTRNAFVLAEVVGCAQGVEPHSFYSETPQAAGRGLADSLRQLHEACEMDIWPCEVYNDLNAEHWRAIANSNALTQLRIEWPVDEAVYYAPFDSFGETGSAASLLGVCLALQAMEQGRATFERALICSSTEHGDVAVLLLKQPQNPRFHERIAPSALFPEEPLEDTRPKILEYRPIRDQNYMELYQVHLEEAASLYGQRSQAIFDEDILWSEIDDFVGNRLAAHLDALALGGALAEEASWAHAEKNLAWGQDLFVTVSTFCRLDHPEWVHFLFDAIDWDEEEIVQGVTDALCFELPQAWAESFTRICINNNAHTAKLAATVAAYRRLDVADLLLAGVKTWAEDSEVLSALIHALGKIRSTEAVEEIQPLLEHENSTVRSRTVEMLLRCGRKDLITIPPAAWSPMLQVIAGDLHSFRPYTPGLWDKSAIEAIGMVGFGDTPEPLIAALSNETVAKEAAFALNLITGAQLQEEHFQVEEIDEDLLFDDELERHKKGELFAPGKEPGQIIKRLSQNPADWQVWWDEHQTNFTPNERYRYGKPFSKDTLLAALVDAQTPNRMRREILEELNYQFNTMLDVEVHMPIQQQRERILKGGPLWE